MTLHAEPTYATAPTGDSRCGRILVVDDDETLRRLACDLLAEDGLEAVPAPEAEEAQALIEAEAFDLVISDVRMPGRSGVDLLRWCRETGQDVPFMLITGYAELDALAEALNLGAQQFVQKPFRPGDFLEAVNKLLAAKHLERKNEELQRQLSEYNSRLRQEVVDAVIENQVLFMATLTSLANAVDARDPYTHTHSASVATLAEELARRLTLSGEERETAGMAGHLHDIGKIAVPETILQKPAALTEEEFALIREHPERGARILEPLPNFEQVLPAVRYHHERFDGNGYPRRLRGAQIPLLARVLAVCDAWDAMTTDRPYRRALSTDQAAARLREHAGTQFDPEFVEAFLA